MTIQVDYGAMETAQADIKGIADAMENKLAALKQRLGELAWEGADRDAYQAAQDKWDRAVQDMNAILAEVGRAVAKALENYQNTETQTANLWQ